MADNFQSFKVAANEQSSSSKFDNFVQALEDAINSLDNTNIAAAAAIAASKLAAGSNGDFLQTVAGVPTWGPGPSSDTYQTTLPGSPVNGQTTILVDSTTSPTYAWRFRFNSAKSSNKWDFIGGAPLSAEVATTETTASTTYVALTTPGPSVAVPVAGDYIVEHGFTGRDTVGGHSAQMSYDIGGTGAVDADQALAPNLANFGVTVARAKKKAGLTAVTLTAKYKTDTSGNGSFANRWIRITPIAIGG